MAAIISLGKNQSIQAIPELIDLIQNDPADIEQGFAVINALALMLPALSAETGLKTLSLNPSSRIIRKKAAEIIPISMNRKTYVCEFQKMNKSGI